MSAHKFLILTYYPECYSIMHHHSSSNSHRYHSKIFSFHYRVVRVSTVYIQLHLFPYFYLRLFIYLSISSPSKISPVFYPITISHHRVVIGLSSSNYSFSIWVVVMFFIVLLSSPHSTFFHSSPFTSFFFIPFSCSLNFSQSRR